MNDVSAIEGRSVPEFAKAYGISVPTVWRLIKRHELLAHKIGTRTIILAEHERAFRDNLRPLHSQVAA